VERDLQEGRRVGVSGTPSFFVNGRMLGGAQPVEEFVRLIEDELERADSSS
jgi:protein-disulfide isomerase